MTNTPNIDEEIKFLCECRVYLRVCVLYMTYLPTQPRKYAVVNDQATERIAVFPCQKLMKHDRNNYFDDSFLNKYTQSHLLMKMTRFLIVTKKLIVSSKTQGMRLNIL